MRKWQKKRGSFEFFELSQLAISLIPWNFLFSFPSQFYPRTTRLNFITHVTCGLSISTITITPTIPARQNDDNLWPKISFWLPSEIQLLDQSQCDIELRGTQNITLRIKATCPAIGAGGGLKAIIPYIANVHSRVWNTRVNLPTIWVSRQITSIRDLQKHFLKFTVLHSKHTVQIDHNLPIGYYDKF